MKSKESDWHFRDMSKKKIYILTFLWFSFAGAFGQDVILADKTDGCDSLTVQLTLDPSRPQAFYNSIVWNFGDGISESGGLVTTHTYGTPGVYTVSCVINNGGDIVTAQDLIRIGATPFADFSFEDISASEADYAYRFHATHFNAVDGISIESTWRFPDGTEIIDSLAEFTFSEDSIYQVFLLLEDEVGCSDSILKKVPVSKQLLVPNVFSPNGDEINDYFEVTTPGDYSYSFRVFSKAGLEVYSSISPLIRWDGRTISGQEASPGVYFYVISSDETPTETALSGYLYLFR